MEHPPTPFTRGKIIQQVCYSLFNNLSSLLQNKPVGANMLDMP